MNLFKNIPNNWSLVTVEEIAAKKKGSVVTGPFGSSIGKKYWTDLGVPVIRGNNIVFDGPKFIDDNFVFISNEYYKSKMTRYTAVKDDIIFTAAGTIGQIGIIPSETKFPFYIVSNKQMRLRLDTEAVDPRFAFYFFRTKQLREIILNNNTGSTIPLINLGVLRSLPFILPPLPIQRRIASILGALDDKIELNLEMNKTLEEMAMALYKHWFVDFGPFKDGKFIESELGMIPEGWEVKEIGKSIETLGGGTPSTKIKEYWHEGEIPWYSPTDLTKAKSLYSLGTAKQITKLGLAKSSAKLFPSYSLLMSSRATIGEIAITRKESCTNQGFITLIPNEKYSLYQLHGWLVTNMDLIISKANGSTFKEISKSNFRALQILKCPDINHYNAEVQYLYDLIESNILENESLITIRDTLLPKLISGEIEVKEVEEEVSRVV